MKLKKLIISWSLLLAIIVVYICTGLVMSCFEYSQDSELTIFVLAIIIAGCFSIVSAVFSILGFILSFLLIKRANKLWINLLAVLTCCVFLIIIIQSIIFFI